MIELNKRLTHTYVGTWQHLDKWQFIGNADEIGTKQLPRSEADEDDPCDPITREVFVIVSPEDGVSDGDIRTALLDTYTQWGCAHEYDCCGCRSYSATKAERKTGDLWRVVIHSSRNF